MAHVQGGWFVKPGSPRGQPAWGGRYLVLTIANPISQLYNQPLEDMVTSQREVEALDGSRRKIIIISAVIAALVIAVLFYFLLRATSGDTVQPILEGAIRAGSPEFDQYQSKIVLDEPDAHEAKRGLGDIWMSLETTARNFTGRTLSGLEVRGAVVDHQGKAVKERTVIVVPGSDVPELGPNDTMRVQVTLEGMTDTDDRANIRMEVVGFKFKQ